ncbi:MAG: hypothetical protein ACOH2I_05590 [Pseudomonas sp.]
MHHLSLRTKARGLILSVFLLLAMGMLAALAIWQLWYLTQLSSGEAELIGLAVRLTPAAMMLAVFFSWLGALRLAVGKRMVWATIQCYRWLFGSATAVMLSLLGVTTLLLQLGDFRWGVQDDQVLRLGSALAGLLLLLAAAGFVGYRIAGRLDGLYGTGLVDPGQLRDGGEQL